MNIEANITLLDPSSIPPAGNFLVVWTGDSSHAAAMLPGIALTLDSLLERRGEILLDQIDTLRKGTEVSFAGPYGKLALAVWLLRTRRQGVQRVLEVDLRGLSFTPEEREFLNRAWKKLPGAGLVFAESVRAPQMVAPRLPAGQPANLPGMPEISPPGAPAAVQRPTEGLKTLVVTEQSPDRHVTANDGGIVHEEVVPGVENKPPPA